MESITYNLVCFLANVDFVRDFVKYLPSKNFAKLIFISKEFTPKYIMSIIKQDYKELYYNFISQREKHYPLIFSFHFKYHDVNTLSEYLAEETIQNLKSNQPIIYIPDKIRTFNPHDKKIREILYQCFSLYLSKPIQMIGKDGTISFDEVGSIMSHRNAIIDTNGKWVDSFENGVYSTKLIERYDNNGDSDPLGMFDEYGFYFIELYDIYINSLFVLLHKFDIKLKNKLIVDRIVISPFEQELSICDLCEDIRSDVLYPHHINAFYGNIEENLELVTRTNIMQFYSMISVVPTGIAYLLFRHKVQFTYENIDENKDEDVYEYPILGDDVNKYKHMLLDGSLSDEAHINELVSDHIRPNPHFKYNLQPHLNTKKYNTAYLLDYIDTAIFD